jgi:hypothetical protein
VISKYLRFTLNLLHASRHLDLVNALRANASLEMLNLNASRIGDVEHRIGDVEHSSST